jgi:acyl-coenzyme A thioesterase PaaI-like protein
VVRRGRRVAFMEAALYSPEGKLAAQASSTGVLADL